MADTNTDRSDIKSATSAGRYAPSPSGPLHMGNLRTAFAAWAWARTTGRKFILRIDDIDPHRNGYAEHQIHDLEQLGIDWDGPVIYQSERIDRYRDTLSRLAEQNMIFECYCSRKDIRLAAGAPHVLPGHYPGTCQKLTAQERVDRRKEFAEQGRIPALRLSPSVPSWTISDSLKGSYTGPVDSFVLLRNDGGPAYNLASVVDDLDLGVDQVVRGDDLLWTAPGQSYLESLISESQFPKPAIEYGHVPLVLNEKSERLAKRDGAVTVADLLDVGWTREKIIRTLVSSLTNENIGYAAELLNIFNPKNIPVSPYHFNQFIGLIPAK